VLGDDDVIVALCVPLLERDGAVRDADLLARWTASRLRSVELQASGSRAAQSIRSDGVRAVISPATPDRWDLNCAAYADEESFMRELTMLDEAFAEAGVGGWAVRVPDNHRSVVALLGSAGFQPEAQAFAMGRELDGPIVPPNATGSIAVRRDWDLAAAGRINDAAYGDRPGEWYAALGELRSSEGFAYLATLGGAPASCVLGFDHQGDAVQWYLATLPSARRRRLGRLLKLTGLRDAQARGCTTATSHTTPSGVHVSKSCGYRRLASVTAWVRRFEPRPEHDATHDARAPARAGHR
jgi:ribosomal protein S18 acetylase RimI-like enzyme